MNLFSDFPQYESYQATNNVWLGEVPSHWELKRFKYLANAQKGKLPKKLSSSNDDGVLPPYLSMDYLRGNEASQFVLDRDAVVIDDNEILLLWDGSNSGEFIKSKNGVVSSTVASIKFFGLDKSFAWYAISIVEKLLRNSTVGMGIPHVDGDELKNSILPIPTKSEQKSIAKFLDKKTYFLDSAISTKSRQIALFKERKQIIIEQLVTTGLNPNIQKKNSNIDWIGEIPEHWEIKRAKYLLDEVDERSEKGDEELLSVSHLTGVTPRSEKNVSMFMAEDYSGSKLCRDGDLVINIMWAWMGALGVSNRTGIVSPSYGVFRQQRANTFHPIYLEYLLKSTKYVEYYNKVSTGLHSSRLRFYGHMLMAMKLGFPPYEEQCEIIKYLDIECGKIDKAIDGLEQQLVNLKEYRSSLINSAVTGKFKVPETT